MTQRAQEMLELADKIAAFSPARGPISLIARERRLIENALRLAAQADGDLPQCAQEPFMWISLVAVRHGWPEAMRAFTRDPNRAAQLKEDGLDMTPLYDAPQPPQQGVRESKTLHGMIAAIYGTLDVVDCAWIDREWAKMRGLVVTRPDGGGA
jgi:hypothetical protein